MKLRQAVKIYVFSLYSPFKKYAFSLSICNSILSDVNYAFKHTSSNGYYNIMREKCIQMYPFSQRVNIILSIKRVLYTIIIFIPLSFKMRVAYVETIVINDKLLINYYKYYYEYFAIYAVLT